MQMNQRERIENKTPLEKERRLRMQVNQRERIEHEMLRKKKEDCNACKCIKEKGLSMR